jgi:c-di-GMP-binding flagellar brake protein YcgR
MASRAKTGVGGSNWIQFFAKGKEAGFSFKEMEMLRQLVDQAKLEDPCLLFTSQEQLDKCISIMVKRLKTLDEHEEKETHDFLSKLYDYRQNIEMSKPTTKGSITNSREVAEGQILRILVEGVGAFKSQVVKNYNQYMTITRPVNNKISTKLSWEGTKIAVYFWRDDDAGYVFDALVQDEVFSLGISSLKITQGDSLFRTQKRKSVRLKMHKAAYLYLVPHYESPHKLEGKPGLKCLLEDISETGCAVTVGGKAESDIRVKVQFALDKTPICMTGNVRSMNYDEDTNRSTLHIQAEPLPIEIRNIIFGEVFGMISIGGGEESLPFRIMDTKIVDTDLRNISASSEHIDTDLSFANFGIGDDKTTLGDGDF